MRMTAATIYRDMNASMERAGERLLDLQQQAASGKRISKPSDDPSGAAAAIGDSAVTIARRIRGVSERDVGMGGN